MIAFVGIDGSGKSTLIDLVEEKLNSAYHGRITKKHLRPSVLPRLGSLRRTKETVVREDFTKPREKKPAARISSELRALYYFLDYLIGYIFVDRLTIARRSCILLYDRHHIDFLVEPERFSIDPRATLLGMFALLRRPDVYVFCDVDPHVAYTRKPEVPPEIAAVTKRRLVAALPSNDVLHYDADHCTGANEIVFKLTQLLADLSCRTKI